MSQVVVLLIDDNAGVHEEVDRVLVPPLIDRILHARLPGDGIRLAVEQLPDLILLDIHMPDIDGFKVCRLLKENSSTRDIPILFLTVETKADHIARALDCGGADYVSKPFNKIELQARIRVALRAKQLIALLKDQARIDALTGLLNRSALDDALAGALSSHERTGTPSSLLMFDIDHFKEINDLYGHGVGDEVLRAVGASLRRCCRPYDSSYRYGGDEFAVIFGQTDGEGARIGAERLIEGIRTIEVAAGNAKVHVTVSGGVVATSELTTFVEPAEFMKAVDVRLYAAKKHGRDCVVCE